MTSIQQPMQQHDPAGLDHTRALVRASESHRASVASSTQLGGEERDSRVSDSSSNSAEESNSSHAPPAASSDDSDISLSLSGSEYSSPESLTHAMRRAESFPHLASTPAPAEQETPEEKAYELMLSDLDPTKLPVAQRTAIAHLAACCLPPSSRPHSHSHSSPLHRDSSNGSSADESRSPPPVAEPGEGLDLAESWELRYLDGLVKYMKLDRLLLHALQPLLGRNIDPAPFVPTLHSAVLSERMKVLLLLLHFSIVALGSYDARVRAMLRSMCAKHLLDVNWRFFTRQENRYAILVAQDLAKHSKSQSTRSKVKRWASVGLAGAGAGALLFLTGGLAAPALGAGLASLGIAGAASSAVFLASTAGAILVATVFGGVGAGLVGYKMHRRTGGLKEFRFEKLSATKEVQGMCVTLCINGWLSSMEDYHTIWAPLVPGRVICSTMDSTTDGTQGSSSSVQGMDGKLISRENSPERTGSRSSNTSNHSSSSDHAAAHLQTNPHKDPHAQVGNTGLTAGQLLRREEKEVEEMWERRVGGGENRRSGADYPGASLQRQDSSSVVTSSSHTHFAFNRTGLAEYSEVYTLRWESPWLLRFGSGLRDLSAKDLSGPATTVGLQQTALAGVVAAIAWPVALLQVGDLIDNPWLVVLNRCEQAAIELANALEARVAGARPITIVAYSMGARVVFLALEELYNRARQRRKLREQQLANAVKEALAPHPNQPAASNANAVSQSNQAHLPSQPPAKKPGLLDRMRAYKKSKQSSSSSSSVPPGGVDTSGGSGKGDPLTDEKLDAHGVILDVFLFGAAIPATFVRWARVRSMVSGRLVNGYSTQDWLLRFVYPLTNLSKDVAGLMPIRRRGNERKQYAKENPAPADAPIFLGDEGYPGVRPPQPIPVAKLDQSRSMAPPPLPPRPSSNVFSSGSTSSVGTVQASASAPIQGSSAAIDHEPMEFESDEEELDLTSSSRTVESNRREKKEGKDESSFELDELSPDLPADASQSGSSSASHTIATVPPISQTNARQQRSQAGVSAQSHMDSNLYPASAYARYTAEQSYTRTHGSVPLVLQKTVCSGIESFNCTPLVKGHRDYPNQMEMLLTMCNYQP